MPLGSKRVSKEAEIFKELECLGLGRCFSAKLEQTSNNRPKMVVFGWILDVFEDSSILTEKQQPKHKNSNSLKFSASFDTLLDPRGAKASDEMIREANTPVCLGFTLMFSLYLRFIWASGGSNQKLVKQKKVTNKSCQVCFSDEKNHHHGLTTSVISGECGDLSLGSAQETGTF